MEEITFEDLAGDNIDYYPDDWQHCIVKETKVEYFDTEKGYTRNRCVVQYNENQKYYSFTYIDWGSGGLDDFDDLEEVFAKTKTITYYEKL